MGNTSGLVGLVLVVIFIVVAIAVGNFFFAKVLGVDVSALPPFFKFIVHMIGVGFVFIFVKKFFDR